MNAVLGTRSKSEWIAAFDAAGVPAGPVHTIGEALAHPQTLARGMVVDLVHPQAGPDEGAGLPGPLLGDADARCPAGAAARRAHARGIARAWLHRRGDRRAHRCGDRAGGSEACRGMTPTAGASIRPRGPLRRREFPPLGQRLHLEVVVERIQIVRDVDDLLAAPAETRVFRPAVHLLCKTRPVLGQSLVAPMDLCRVTGDAVRRIEKFAARRLGAGLCGDSRDGAHDQNCCDTMQSCAAGSGSSHGPRVHDGPALGIAPHGGFAGCGVITRPARAVGNLYILYRGPFTALVQVSELDKGLPTACIVLLDRLRIG